MNATGKEKEMPLYNAYEYHYHKDRPIWESISKQCFHFHRPFNLSWTISKFEFVMTGPLFS